LTREASKICDVVGQQMRDPMGQHTGNDVGVVDLLASACNGGEQIQKVPHDGGAIFGDKKAPR
jgi:hypothetical protein